MLVRSLMDSLIARGKPYRTRRAAPRSTMCRPAVEALEDRCTPTATVYFAGMNTEVRIVEGNDGLLNAVFTVRVSEPHSNTISVNYNTVDGTATPGSDYNAASGKLTFAPSVISQSIAVAVRGDRLVEPEEWFGVQLSNARGAKITGWPRTVTIVDNEPRIFVGSTTLLEGNSGNDPMMFTAWLSRAYDLPVTVNYTVTDGTATAGIDYTAAPMGTLVFPPDQRSQTITAEVIGDRLFEQDETFVVNLSTPESYAAVINGPGVGTIRDNEPRISIPSAMQDYYAAFITFTVGLAAPYDQAVTVDFTTVDGSAFAGVDYVAISGTLTFNPGETIQTITVQLLVTDPSDKYFSIHLSNASANALLMNEWAIAYWFVDYGGGGGYYDAGDAP